MSYTVLEEGYQEWKESRPRFYLGEDVLNRHKLFLSKQQEADCLKVQSTEQDESYTETKQVIVGVCAMAKKSQSKAMKEILMRLEEFEFIRTIVFPESTILNKPVDKWPLCDCLISFHSKGFPLAKAIEYVQLREPYVISDLHMQYDIQDRRKVYKILEDEGIELPRYAVLDRDSPNPEERELVEGEDHIEVRGVIFNKPFVEKPISAEDHNIYIYYPTSAGGGSQRLFRKIGSRSSVYSSESHLRKNGSYIYEEFMPTDGTDVKVYTVGPDYAHAEARKSPALDGKVERDKEGKEIRYPVILTNTEKLIARKVCLAFKQTVCGFDLLRANGKSYVCDVNGFSFVKNSMKYYDDCAKILGNMILRNLAPQLQIPWSIPFQLDDPPIVPTTFGKMMELRCVIAVIRHGDRTPKQKMKMEVKHPKFFEVFEKYNGYKTNHIKLKKPKQLQEILDISRLLLSEIENNEDPDIDEDKQKLEQLKSVLEMYGHFSGINRKIQLKYQPKGRPRRSSSEEDSPREPSLVLILKWGGELTPAGRVQAEELGRVFRCMYPGGQGEYAGTQGLGLLRLHSTFRHDLKIYASDEGRVQMTAAAFAKGLLALEGELTPILVQMVKSANTNGLLDNDCDSSKYQNMVKQRLHEALQKDRDFDEEDYDLLNPTRARSIQNVLSFIKNPVKACQHVYELVQELNKLIKEKREKFLCQEYHLYHGETWDLMQRRWAKLEKDFKQKSGNFDISKIPDIYDCIKYDLQHNQYTLQFTNAEELYMYAKALADIVIPQEYGISKQEKLTIGLGICTPLLKKIRADMLRNYSEEEDQSETVNRLNPHYSHGVSSPGRHVRTRLYFTSESHIHSLLTVLRFGGLVDETKDEQWRRAMEYVSAVSELNYMTQVVIMLYEDPTKDAASEDRFHVELHFSPGVVCCMQKNTPKGPGFRPQSRSAMAKRNDSGKTITNHSPNPHSIKEEDSDELTFDHDMSNCDSSPLNSAHADSAPDSPTISEEPNTQDIPGLCLPGEDNRSEQDESEVETYKDCPQDTSLLLARSFPIVRSMSVSSTGTTDTTSDAAYSKSAPKGEVRSPLTQSLDNVRQRPTNTESPKGQRHSVHGQLSTYLRLCSVANLPKFGSTNSLFSTAVISGSSSAPELKDVLHSPPEGCPSIPSIRPLETLHNALSLKQLDEFLGRLTEANQYRLPLSSPSQQQASNPQKDPTIRGASNQVISPTSSFGWSGPPSFISSSGQSSPNSSQLDLYSRFKAPPGETDINAGDFSGPESINSFSGPPSPIDQKFHNHINSS